MARKRDEAIKANLAGWLDDAGDTAAGGAQAAPAAGSTSTPATPAPAQGGAFPGGRRMVTAYLDASEAAELEARAAADDRSVSYIVRAAVRAYLGMK